MKCRKRETTEEYIICPREKAITTVHVPSKATGEGDGEMREGKNKIAVETSCNQSGNFHRVGCTRVLI